MVPGGELSRREKPPQKHNEQTPGRLIPLAFTSKNETLRDASPPRTNPWKTVIPKRQYIDASSFELNPHESCSLPSADNSPRNAGSRTVTDPAVRSKCERKSSNALEAAEGQSPNHNGKTTVDESNGSNSKQIAACMQSLITGQNQSIPADSSTKGAASVISTGEQTRGRSQNREVLAKEKGEGNATVSTAHPSLERSSPANFSFKDGEITTESGCGHQPSRDRSSEIELGKLSDVSSSTSSPSMPAPSDLAMLWRFPQGSDVRVFSFAPNLHSQAHRKVIAERSAWFRDNLPPSKQDGSSVDITVNCCPSAVISCLYFMYTCRLEWCENQDLWDRRYLPQCVLSYCASIYFRIPDMVEYVLDKVILRARNLRAELVSISLRYGEHAIKGLFHFSYAHLQDALELAYTQPDQDLMKPMRQALAFVWESVAPFLMCHSLVTEKWYAYQSKVMLDVLELRRHFEATSNTAAPWTFYDKESINALLDKPSLKKGTKPGVWSDSTYFDGQGYGAVETARYGKPPSADTPHLSRAEQRRVSDRQD